MAGECGVNPEPRTARELVWMVRGRRKAAWSVASHLLAQQANIYRGKGDREVMPHQCNPYADKAAAKAAVQKVNADTFIRLVAVGLGAKVVDKIPGVFVKNEAWEKHKAKRKAAAARGKEVPNV